MLSLHYDPSARREQHDRGPGAACQPDDPCAGAGLCNDAGQCVPTEPVTCDDPPSSCHADTGECDPISGCTYPLLPEGTPCGEDDGDPCTPQATCDQTGACVTGPPCQTNDPCLVAQCTPEGCELEPVADGTSCGAVPGERCCNGQCVDISSDADHCGGCNTSCAPGQVCESIEVTNSCEPHPPDTSARCRCTENAHCPLGQICRIVSPGANRCAPESNGNCDGVMVQVDQCPNYCDY